MYCSQKQPGLESVHFKSRKIKCGLHPPIYLSMIIDDSYLYFFIAIRLYSHKTAHVLFSSWNSITDFFPIIYLKPCFCLGSAFFFSESLSSLSSFPIIYIILDYTVQTLFLSYKEENLIPNSMHLCRSS